MPARKENAGSRKIAKANVLRESRESWNVTMCDICLVCSCILLWNCSCRVCSGRLREGSGRIPWMYEFDTNSLWDVPRRFRLVTVCQSTFCVVKDLVRKFCERLAKVSRKSRESSHVQSAGVPLSINTTNAILKNSQNMKRTRPTPRP